MILDYPLYHDQLQNLFLNTPRSLSGTHPTCSGEGSIALGLMIRAVGLG